MSTRPGSAVVTLPTDTTILITRSFEAPLALVWDTLTTPRHVLRWWGPVDETAVSCEVDPTHRIVTTEVFDGHPDASSVSTTTLDHVDGVTSLETLVQHASREFRDRHLASGLENVVQESFDRLDDLLDRSGAPAERFRRVAGRFTDRAREVAPDAWDNPTPCDGWVARDVVRHMVDWMPSILAGAGVALEPVPSVDDDPVLAWTALADQLQALLDDPTVASTEIDLGPAGQHTIESGIDMVIVGDVVMHTWDLARATGLDDTVDAGIAREMLLGMEPIDDLLRSSGHFGPKVPAPDDADDQTKLMAFSGRDPNWPG